MPSQSRSGSAHCEWYFAPTVQSLHADWPMRVCMASACSFKMHTHESRSERALHSHVLESGFLGRSRSQTPFFLHFKSLIWNCFAFTRAKIKKGPNHVLKRLSERNLFSCEQAHSYSSYFWNTHAVTLFQVMKYSGSSYWSYSCSIQALLFFHEVPVCYLIRLILVNIKCWRNAMSV